MFRLERHIEDLLMRHDCVILPGFGGFVTHHVGARIDASDGVMLPPSTTVGFNPQLTLNDSLLVQSYVEAYDYSFPEALHIVEEEIRQLQDTLHQYGRYELRSVGELSINKDGNYEFEPAAPGILMPDLYGLPAIELTDTESFITSLEAKENSRLRQQYRDDDGEKVIRISTRTLRKVAAVFIVVLLLASIPFLSRNAGTRDLLSRIDLSPIVNLMPKATVSHNEDLRVASAKPMISVTKKAEAAKPSAKTETETQADTAKAVMPTEAGAPAGETAVKEEPRDVFTVVLAARVSERNAVDYVGRLHASGIKSARVCGQGKSRKVVCGSYATEEEAQQAKRELAAKADVKDAWVMKAKES